MLRFKEAGSDSGKKVLVVLRCSWEGEGRKFGALFAPTLPRGIHKRLPRGLNGKGGQSRYALPSTQLCDYSLKLDTREPKPPGSPDSAELIDLSEETIRSFVGFSLSPPIPDDFWKIGR